MNQLTPPQAHAICDGLEQQRKTRIQANINARVRRSDSVDESLRHKDDFTLLTKEQHAIANTRAQG